MHFHLWESSLCTISFWAYINFPWGHVRSHSKFGPDLLVFIIVLRLYLSYVWFCPIFVFFLCLSLSYVWICPVFVFVICLFFPMFIFVLCLSLSYVCLCPMFFFVLFLSLSYVCLCPMFVFFLCLSLSYFYHGPRLRLVHTFSLSYVCLVLCLFVLRLSPLSTKAHYFFGQCTADHCSTHQKFRVSCPYTFI